MQVCSEAFPDRILPRLSAAPVELQIGIHTVGCDQISGQCAGDWIRDSIAVLMEDLV